MCPWSILGFTKCCPEYWSHIQNDGIAIGVYIVVMHRDEAQRGWETGADFLEGQLSAFSCDVTAVNAGMDPLMGELQSLMAHIHNLEGCFYFGLSSASKKVMEVFSAFLVVPYQNQS